MTKQAVRLRGIHKHYGPAHVLRGIDLEADTGDVVSIIGSSGSGKSTLLRCIPFLEQPDSGEVTVGDATLRRETGGKLTRQDKAAIRAIRSRVGFVFQNFNLWPHLTALGNVMEVPLQVQKRPRAEVREEAEALLEKVGLSARRDAWPALAIRPEALLFDEPTSALDPELVGEVLAVIRGLAEEGRTMILVTHEMNFARHVSTKSIFLHGGMIEEAGSPEQVFGDPVSERCRRFVTGLATSAAR